MIRIVNMIFVLLLSIIQGVTEFLPVSSSSHLIIISEYLDIVKSPWSSIYSDNDIISNKNLHQLVNGYKVVKPELVYHKKVWLNRYKDQLDVFEMNEYAKFNDSWNWDIINSHLPTRYIFRRVINRLTRMGFKKTFLIGFFGLLLKC